MWYAVIAVVVITGVVAIFISRSKGNARPIANKDHWHAFLGANVCGQWINHAIDPTQAGSDKGIGAPAFEAPRNIGIHSHGDGLIHIHPYSAEGQGDRATIGRFLADNEGADWELTSDTMKLWDDQTHKNGGACPGKDVRATIKWAVNGKERSGNPSDYRPEDCDTIAVAYLPESEKVPYPPDAVQALVDIGDTVDRAACAGKISARAQTVPGSGQPSSTSASDSTAPGSPAAPTVPDPAASSPTVPSPTPTS